MLIDLIKNSKIPKGMTHIAGPPNSGKTTLIYQICKGIREGKKGLILDCEMNFSAQRLQDITRDKKIDLRNIIIMNIVDRNQQFNTVMKTHKFIVNENFNFIAINGITDHFRYASEKEEVSTYRTLSMQLAYLKMVSKKEKIPILMINQVSAFKSENKKEFKPIANSVMKHYSDRYIILQHINRKLLKATLKDEEVYYTVSPNGIEIRN